MTTVAIDRDRLVETASRMIGVHSFTGDEEGMARLMVELLEARNLHVQWQQVEDGRANALGTWAGTGGGPSLMFNGHMDTSYSGREPWLRNVRGFQPSAFVEDGRLYGLGISNMKGALACYVEAVSALQDGGVRLRGDSRDVRQDSGGRGGAVDVHAGRGAGADQQRGGAGVASGGAASQALVWQPQCRGWSVREPAVERGADAEEAGPIGPGVPAASVGSASSPLTYPNHLPRQLNRLGGYVEVSDNGHCSHSSTMS